MVDCDLLEVLPPIGSGAGIEHCADLVPAGAYDLDRVEPLGAGAERDESRCTP